MIRVDGRAWDALRPVKMTRNYLKYPEGAVLVECGDTKVICAASVEERVPPFLKGTESGWITAEYALLPRATQVRNMREAVKGRLTGRTQEIQRLIGRALRSVVDLRALGEKTVWVDCDVIQADGGTRTASITGAFVAVVEAIDSFYDRQKPFPVRDFLAAVSVGLVEDDVLLDLNYQEDSHAVVDMNVVMTGDGRLVEIQGTGEQHPFSQATLQEMLTVAQRGIAALIDCQKEVLGPLAWKVGREP